MKIFIGLFLFISMCFGQDGSVSLFGNNTELRDILNNDYQVTIKKYMQEKNEYLKNLKIKQQFNGVYLKGGFAKQLTNDKKNLYNLRLEWNIFKNGYYESKKELNTISLKEEIEFDDILNNYKETNLQMALFELEAVNNNIDWYFLLRQNYLQKQNLQLKKRQYEQYLITQEEFSKVQNQYQNTQILLKYFQQIKKKPFDNSLKSYMLNIENKRLPTPSSVIKNAVSNSLKIKKLNSKIKLSTHDKKLEDDLKLNIYLENKKAIYTADNKNDMVTGVSFSLPVKTDYDNKEKSVYEKKLYRLKKTSLIKNISTTVYKIYEEINHLKLHIKTLQQNNIFLQKKLAYLKEKERYPLNSSKPNHENKNSILNSINTTEQKIWKEKLNILKLLVRLQYISDLKIL